MNAQTALNNLHQRIQKTTSKKADYSMARLFERLNEHVSGRYSDLKISFEFFPPKDAKSATSLWNTIDKLSDLNPDFVSITYGALRSSRDLTHNLIKDVQERTDLVAVPHLTCVDSSKDEIRDIADRYWDLGVRHIVALRGDCEPCKNDATIVQKREMNYATDLIDVLKEKHDFEISVAAYPEVHPDAPSADFDFENLRRKVNAGASRAMTQFFFNNEAFLRFRDKCSSEGINADIVPGILPVTNYKSLLKFTDFAQVHIPQWLHDLYQGTERDPMVRKLLGINIALEQIKVLVANGVEHFHFYTLNRAELTHAICHFLGARSKEKQKIINSVK